MEAQIFAAETPFDALLQARAAALHRPGIFYETGGQTTFTLIDPT